MTGVFNNSIKNRLLFSLCALLLAGGAVLIRSSSVLEKTELGYSALQAIIFPLLVLVFSTITLLGSKIPRAAVMWAVGAAAISLAHAFGVFEFQRPGVYVARLQNDEFEVDTRHVRENLNAAISRGSFRASPQAARLYSSPQNSKEAQQVLEARSSALALIWGTDRWLWVSFKQGVSNFPPESRAFRWFALAGLNPVTHVSGLGLSKPLSRESAGFLAALTGVLQAVARGEYRNDQRLFSVIEADLKIAGEGRGVWKSIVHNSYPLWMLGNLYLEKALSGEGYGRAEMHCAERAYSRARRFLKPGDHPELLSAILNNRGLVHYLQALVEGRQDYKMQALRELKKAAMLFKASLGRSGNRDENIAARNYRSLALREPAARKQLAQFEKKLKAKGKKKGMGHGKRK